MYRLAEKTKSNVIPVYNDDDRIPLNVGMDVNKLNKFLYEN